ncbi:hypothetical protein FK178_11395 [Antarcticibacterium arcticum]|uniref:Uncharacterized protein n=1 Tax=Antarcticibacterium arcticum TaxID=2585771 RepID=A0A5B8YJW2_9FLAO|nr:hypothetical protein [Antarcticibacterium arcticum]QED38280.1 hypothetical protein FK178_11395 [Antarcticibacterium arcticum]
MQRPYFILVLLFCLNSCQNQEKFQKNEAAESNIYSIIIDELAVHLPPPWPPPNGLSRRELDSIKRIKLELVVDTVMFKTDLGFQLTESHQEYQPLVDEISTLDERAINPKTIKSSIGHSLVYGMTLEASSSPYPQLIKISRISFNCDTTKAALFASRNTGRLSGVVILYLLEKENNIWEIVYEQKVLIS